MNSNYKITIDITKLLVGLLMLCGLLTGLLPQRVVDVAVVAVCAMLFVNGNLLYAYPFMLFYYGTFGLLLGISTYRIFTLLFLLDAVLRITKKTEMRTKYLIPVLVYILYLVIVMSGYSIRRTIFCFVDILCALVAAGKLSENVERMRPFFKIFVLVALLSCVSGIVLKNVLTEEYEMGAYAVSRFTATFEDPNYLGFFMTLAIFAVVTMKFFNPVVRLLAIVAIYAAILASASMTAIVVHVILWPIYLVVTKKINIRVFIAIIVTLLLALGLYEYGLENPDVPVIGNVSFRVQEKLEFWENDDISGVTTNRNELTKIHWEYFMKQPFWKKMIGGTPVSTIWIYEGFSGAAHNEYVDMLLNIGLIGTAVMLWFMLSGTLKRLKLFWQTGDEMQIFLFMAKCIWLAYAATLTLFAEFRFMLPFFI